MSIDGFTKHGYHRGLLLTRDGGMYGTIALFDIGEERYVGAEYPDGARQAQPMFWHKGIEAALHSSHRQSNAVRPRLKKEEEPPPLPTRPRLPKSRPHLQRGGK